MLITNFISGKNAIERIIALAFFTVVAINQIFPLKLGAKIHEIFELHTDE